MAAVATMGFRKIRPQDEQVMAKRVWSRSRKVTEFEQKWAEMNGSKHCLSTVNGTNAIAPLGCSLTLVQ